MHTWGFWGKEEKEERKGNGTGSSPEGEPVHWVLCLEAFISLLQVEVLGEVSGEGFSRMFINFPGVLFQGRSLF